MIGDFHFFYDAARALLNGVTPYSIPGFFNPVWTLLSFIPLTLFPFHIARDLYALITVAGFIAALHRFGLKPRYIILVSLFSPLLWLNVLYANVDWIVLLGATLPPPIGIWFVMVKPQIGIGVVLYWLLRRESRCWVVFAPVSVALVLNYALLGLPTTGNFISVPWSVDVFPWGLPLAAWLIYQAIKKTDIAFALSASAFLSPYYAITSWLSLAPLARSWRWLIVVCALSWLIFARWRGAI